MSHRKIVEPKTVPPSKRKIPEAEKKHPPEPWCEPPPEPVALEPLPCTLTIKASAASRSFSPPLGLTGEETFTAELNRPLAAGETVQWSVVRGPNDGDVELATPNRLTTKVRARKPNKAKVRVQLLAPGGVVVCQDEAEISVPHFFFLLATPGLLGALADFGLQVPIQTTDPDRDRKAAVNGQILEATLTRAAKLALILYDGVNVRFTPRDPTAAVGARNFATVKILGLSPLRDRTGFTKTGRDAGNKIADDSLLVYAREFANPEGAALDSPLGKSIFEGIAIQQQRVVANQSFPVPVPGAPVQLGEFVADRDQATTTRQLRINAAFLALARLIGSTVAHEAGHSLGLVPGTGHNAKADGNLMDKGQTRSFEERTGILRFDPNLGLLSFTTPAGLTRPNRAILQKVLPILRET